MHRAAALGELLCDRALKLDVLQIRPCVEENMGNICSPFCSSLLHCLSTTLGGCWNACSEDTFFVLEWLLNRTETLPRYLFLSGFFKDRISCPPFMSGCPSPCGWQLPLALEGCSCRPRPFVGLQKQLGVRVACGIASHLCSAGRVHCFNDFEQALPSLSPVFREGFALECMVGFGRELVCRSINASTGSLLCVSWLTRNPCVPSANKGYFPWSWATTKEQVFSPEMPWRFVCS